MTTLGGAGLQRISANLIGVSFDYRGPLNPFTDPAPRGHLWEVGQDVSRALYPRLFQAIGITYGPGDGVTTFTLPNSCDKYKRGIPYGANLNGAEIAVDSANTGTEALSLNALSYAVSLLTGDLVVLSGAVGGLTSGDSYFVRKLSTYECELYSTRAQAMAAPATTGRANLTAATGGSLIVPHKQYTPSIPAVGASGAGLVGDIITDAFQGHGHQDLETTTGAARISGSGGTDGVTAGSTAGIRSNAVPGDALRMLSTIKDGVRGNSRAGYETRPYSQLVVTMIRYK